MLFKAKLLDEDCTMGPKTRTIGRQNLSSKKHFEATLPYKPCAKAPILEKNDSVSLSLTMLESTVEVPQKKLRKFDGDIFF